MPPSLRLCVLARLFFWRLDPLPLASGAADLDLARLHRLGNDAAQFDREQSVGEARAADFDIIGELETALERAARDAAVELGVRSILLGRLAGDIELVLLRDDLDVVGLEPGDRQRDAEPVVGVAHDVERGKAVGRLAALSLLEQVEKMIETHRRAAVGGKVKIGSHFQILLIEAIRA